MPAGSAGTPAWKLLLAPPLSLLAAWLIGEAAPGTASGLADPYGALWMWFLGPGLLLLAGFGGWILWAVSRWMPRTSWAIAAVVLGYLGIYTLVNGANPQYDAGWVGVVAGWLDVLLALGAILALVQAARGMPPAGPDRGGGQARAPMRTDLWNAATDDEDRHQG